METSNLLTRREVSDKFKVCAHTIRVWEKRGKLLAVRINKRVLRYKQEDVEKLINPICVTSAS